jgi:aryl-phospho-beta-D-glucosidase BglC (GH1 family)
VLVVIGLCVFQTYASLTPEERAKQRYDELMAEEVLSVADLSDVWADEAWSYIQVAIPGATCWTQTKGPLPVDTTKVSKDFLENVIWYLEGESEVPVAEILIYQDRLNRDICFLNSDYKPIYVIKCPYGDYCADDAYALERYPDLYSGKYDEKEIEEIIAHLDPARVLLRVQMVPSDRLYDFLLDQAKGAAAREDEKEDGGGGGAKSGGGSNDLWVAIAGPGQGATNGIEITVHLPTGFTNMIDILTFDAEPGSTFAGIQSDPWILSVTNADTTGTNQILWVDTDTDGATNRFYVAGSSWDQDGDGLASAREIFMHRTDPGLWDTDGDGFSDGDEINIYGTDALDKYSVPPPQMLSVDGMHIVDESTNTAVLKTVNIGAWLQWEQWMMMYEPRAYTNDWGKVYGVDTNAADEIDEATAREILAANVDQSVTLQAADAPLVSSGITTGEVGGGWTWLCPEGVRYIGSFNGGRWIGFTNINFGSGVSNLAIALAVPVNDAGRQIRVRLDGPNGTEIGTLVTKATAPAGLSGSAEWCTFTEQYLTLSTNLSGSHDIYFVGSNAASWQAVANLYRFRFFNQTTNTEALFDTFRDNYFTTNDLDRIRELGYNGIRLCFFHTLLEDDRNPYVYKQSGWDRLDWVIEQCRIRHMWVILDLHSTPGSQNPYHASGYREPFRNRLWYSSYFKDRTAALWVEISSRYATNTTVAGYDLFNEPDPPRQGSTKAHYQQAFSNDILPLLSRLYTAIRSNDTEHLLFMESNLMYTNMWDDTLWWPAPASKGWTNVVYEFHVYDQTVYGQTGVDDWYFTTQKGIADNMVRAFTRLREKRNVPVYVGEFAPWTEQNMDYWTRQLNAHDLSWGHWNYRSWGWDDETMPEKGKTLWGLDYRSKDTTNQIPDLVNDSFATLAGKFALYNQANYTDNAHLQNVLERQASQPVLSKGKCEFYLNTFDGPFADSLSAGWSWRKVAAVGLPEAFHVNGNKARVRVDLGPTVMRFKSREEADARFEVNDATGCRFSLDPITFNVTNVVVGTEVEIRLSAVRDEITASAYEYDTRGIIARLVLDQSAAATNITLYLYEKSGGASTWGNELDSSGSIAFVPGATLELFVNEDSAELSYNGTTYCSGTHTNLDLASWPAGAVCAVEAAQATSGTTWYVELDNFKAWRDDAQTDAAFSDTFAAYPSGIEMVAEPDKLAIQDYWAPSRKSQSYATNEATFWIAKEETYGGTWMSPRRDYQNDVRLLASPTNVVSASASYIGYTNGIGKMCLMPELFPAEIYWDYAGQALYVEFQRNGANVDFTGYRHYGTGGGRQNLGANSAAYVSGQTISLQASTNTLRVYYGTNLVINALHGMTNMPGVYANGAFPHLELQNHWNTTNAAVSLGNVSCQRLSDFTAPEE